MILSEKNVSGYSLEEISQKIHAQLHGDPECRIDRAEPLATATAGAITFLTHSRYKSYLANTQASAVILRRDDAPNCPVNTLVVDNPELAFSQLLNLLYPLPPAISGIHPSAVIGQGCQIDPSVTIGPHCVIEDRVRHRRRHAHRGRLCRRRR